MRIFGDFIASDSTAFVDFPELPGLIPIKNPPISWPYGTGVREFSEASQRLPMGVLLDGTRLGSVFGSLSVQPSHQHVLRLLALVEYLKLCALPKSRLSPEHLALMSMDEKDALDTALRASSPAGATAVPVESLVMTPAVYERVLARHHAQTLSALLPAILASLNLAAGYRCVGRLYELVMETPQDEREEPMKALLVDAWPKSVTATLHRLTYVNRKHIKTTNKWRKAFNLVQRDVAITDEALSNKLKAPRPRVDLFGGM